MDSNTAPGAVETSVIIVSYNSHDDLVRGLPEDNAVKDQALPDLWAHPKMKGIAAEVEDLRKTVLYGDPLLLARPYGKGRVAAYLTTAGTAAIRP